MAQKAQGRRQRGEDQNVSALLPGPETEVTWGEVEELHLQGAWRE